MSETLPGVYVMRRRFWYVNLCFSPFLWDENTRHLLDMAQWRASRRKTTRITYLMFGDW